MIGAFPLHPLDQTTDRYLGWDRYQPMHMIRQDMPLPDIYARLATLLPHYRAHPFGYLFVQYLMPILRDPDHMQVDREDGVGTMTILTHASKLTKNVTAQVVCYVTKQ